MYYALIVLYNKKLNDSKTYKCLKLYSDNINIIVFDNSSEDYIKNNIIECQKAGLLYYTQNKNVGLSKAYNYVINELKNKEAKYLMIFDDDTELNEEYINESLNIMKNGEYDIILPIIKASKHILSPTKLIFNIKYVEVKHPKTIKHSRIAAINTGMIVKMTVYNKVSYDERLFLDDVDHLFIYNAKKSKMKFYIMNSIINQTYSRFEKNDINSEKTRFRIWIKDHWNYCKIRKIMWFYYITSFKHRLREFIKYKDCYFLYYK